MSEPEAMKETIKNLFEMEAASNQKNVKSYYSYLGIFRFVALSMRAIALLLLACGTLIPLVEFAQDFRIWGMSPLKVGYLCLAAAAVIMLIDRIAMFTENHISQVGVVISLNFLLDRLMIEKAVMIAIMKDADATATKALLIEVKKLIDRFAIERSAIVKAEKESWAASRRAAQEQLSQRLSSANDDVKKELDAKFAESSAEQEAMQRGGLSIAMTYPTGYAGTVNVKVQPEKISDGIFQKDYASPRATLALANLPNGMSTVYVELDNGKGHESLVIIPAGKIEQKEFDLSD
jgi:hypothetical protein